MIDGLQPELFREVRKPLDAASWLPKRTYLDPAIYDAEIEQIFKREWLHVGHVSAVPDVGDFMTLTLIGQPLIVVRGKDEVVRCFFNVCKHRGMAVASGSGNADAFKCPYHAWTYDTQGQLFDAPMMDRTTGFDVCNIKLREIKTEVFHGIVFVNFDDNAAPLGPRLADLGEMIAPWNIAELTPAFEDEFIGDFNWKVLVENANEAYHIVAAHFESAGAFAPAELSFSTDDTGRAWNDLYTPYTDTDAVVGGPPIPGLPSWAHERMSFLTLHPHFMITLSSDNMGLIAIHPLGPNKTRFSWTTYVPKDVTNSDDYESYRTTMKEWTRMINREDEAVCIGVQEGINSDGWSPPRYSYLEKPVWQFHQWYLDRMVGRRPELQAVKTA